MGFRIAVVGESGRRLTHPNIEHFGPQPLEIVYEIYSTARLGLNIVPDVYPYSFQDSTKVIEYCASGLGIVTTKYQWVDEFAQARGGNFLDVSRVLERGDVENFPFKTPQVHDLEWSIVMERTNLANHVAAMLAKRNR